MNPMTTHGAFSWVELQSDDPAVARAFYQEVLGWNVVEMPMKDGSAYPGILVGEQPAGGFANKLDAARGWLPYVTVDDVDARAQACAKAGGEVSTEPFDAPGVGRIAIVRDPQGAQLALITYAAPAS